MKMIGSLNAWNLFAQERFPLIKHALLLSFFFFANAFVVMSTFEVPALINAPICLSIIILTFFRLRIFDEIKDYKNDCFVHPDRPLARGLIPVLYAKNMAFFLMAIELVLSLAIGYKSFLGICIVSMYSYLMYKEFFIGKWLKPKLATYALTHTLVSSLIVLYIFSSISNKYVWQAPKSILLFAIANWMIFNVFEFGRKTFGKEEEKKSVESYSRSFGSWGAAFSTLLMAGTATSIAWHLSLQFAWPPLLAILETILFLTLTFVSILYAYSNSQKWGIRFRATCSAFILLYNVILTLGFLL